jgi:glucosyl-3-phosphoglycerate synthase
MSDFAQAGLISTLQRLNDTHLESVTEELAALSRNAPVWLILPCHGGDLERPALLHILKSLRGARWLAGMIVSLNALPTTAHTRLFETFSGIPARFLWNERERLLPVARALGLTEIEPGKGVNVWTALGLLGGEQGDAIVVTQDCDVSSFRAMDLARLCYPLARRDLGYVYAKMYYSRVTDRLYGRVSRLFLAPLLQAMQRVAGHQPLLDFLLTFRYPLAGEAAMTLDVARQLPMSPGWGLEISQLCDLFRRVDPRAVCQVDGGTGYDHKHQPASSGLARMAGQIAAALYAQFAREGGPADAAFRSAVAAAYRREARLALRRSAALALINRLEFDSGSEEAMIEAFGAELDEIDLGPGRVTVLPAWSQLGSATSAVAAAVAALELVAP